MIKAEKGTVRMKGHPALLEAELIATIRGFYQALVRNFGEEFAKKRMDSILEKALEYDEEEAEQQEETSEGIKDILNELRDILKEMEGEK